jgi:hypothetical protein
MPVQHDIAETEHSERIVPLGTSTASRLGFNVDPSLSAGNVLTRYFPKGVDPSLPRRL